MAEGWTSPRISIEDGDLVVRLSLWQTMGPRIGAAFAVLMIVIVQVFGRPSMSVYLFDDLLFEPILMAVFFALCLLNSLQTARPVMSADSSGFHIPFSLGLSVPRDVPWADVVAIEVVNNAPTWKNRARLSIVRRSVGPAWVTVAPLRSRSALAQTRYVADALAQWPTRLGYPPIPVRDSTSTYVGRMMQW